MNLNQQSCRIIFETYKLPETVKPPPEAVKQAHETHEPPAIQAVANNEFQKTVTAYTSYAITTNRPVVAWVGYNSWSKRYELFQVGFLIQKALFFSNLEQQMAQMV